MSVRLFNILIGLVAAGTWQQARAQVVAPSQGGEVSLSRVMTTSIDITFGTRGTGQGRVVAVVAVPDGVTVPLGAADNTFYNANATYGLGATLGQGYAVYCGTGHSLTVTGLQPDTKYYFTNAEYNTDGTSIRYSPCSSSIVVATRPVPSALLATAGPASSPRSVEVYPSPSAGQAVQVLLMGFEREKMTLDLADVLGRPVLTQTLVPLTARHQASLPTELTAGTYLLTLRGSDRIIQKRIVVSN